MQRPRQVALLFLLGTLLLQAAWILAVPPFRGSDEFDHAYRADAVAHGEWAAVTEQAANGRGGLVSVRSSIVESASAMCEFYEYTGRDNCHPVETLSGDRVRVASAASGNQPLFYWVVGTVGRVTDGAQALMVMRLAGAVICALLIALAVYFVAHVSNAKWLQWGLCVALSPVLVYSTAVAAPNGVEMAAGAACWAGLIALQTGRAADASVERRVLLCTVVAAVVLCIPRQLGPLWLLLICLVCLVRYGVKPWISLLGRHGFITALGVVLVGAAAISNVLWVRAAGTLSGAEVSQNQFAENPTESILSVTSHQVPLWIVQTIAAFPVRNEPAPAVVYACFVAAAGTLLIAGLRFGGRARSSLLIAMLVTLAVPFIITIATIDRAGTIWQGRYALPFSVGVCLLAALGLRERPPTWRLRRPVLITLGASLVVAHAASVVGVFVKELDNPAALATGWPYIPVWLACIVSCVGVLLWFVAAQLAEPQTSAVGPHGRPPWPTEFAAGHPTAPAAGVR